MYMSDKLTWDAIKLIVSTNLTILCTHRKEIHVIKKWQIQYMAHGRRLIVCLKSKKNNYDNCIEY